MFHMLQAEPLLLVIDGASWLNIPTLWLLGVVLVLLVIALAIGQTLTRQPESSIDHALLQRFNLRVRAWWMMFAILIAGFLLRYVWTVALFGAVSFWALREFVTMTPTRRGDHRTLFWVFFVFTPLQYLLVGIGRAFVNPQGAMTGWLADFFLLRGVDFYGLYSIMIPVYGSLFIPASIAISGDHKRFLERSAKIQAGLLICVYSLSYAPPCSSWTYKPTRTLRPRRTWRRVPNRASRQTKAPLPSPRPRNARGTKAAARACCSISSSSCSSAISFNTPGASS